MLTFKNSRTFAAAAAIMALLLFTTCEKRVPYEIIGTGTMYDPFQVNNVATLKKVGKDTDGWTSTAYYIQTADIVFTKRDGKWTPISDGDNIRFTGSYDGNGYTIANLTINAKKEYQGLFGNVGSDGVVKNVGLIDCSITSTESRVGGVVAYNAGTVENCYVTGNISGKNYVGGVVGYNRNTLENCYATGNVSGVDYVGGVVGYNVNDNDGTVTNSYATGDVSGRRYTGGVAGVNESTITNSYATGNVSGRGITGGVVGQNDKKGTVTNSYATGNVSGNTTGGVVGLNDNDGTVTNSYATGNVSGNNNTGGVIGHNQGTLSNSYSTGNISGRRDTGGVAGYNERGTVTNSYAIGNISGGKDTGGVVGYNYGGIVSNSYATGDVSVDGNRHDSVNNVGGVVGHNDKNGTVTNSYATGNVSSDRDNAGGVVGFNNGSTVTNSYSTGNVSGVNYVGGVVGNNQGTLLNSYTTGNITGAREVGGVVGGSSIKGIVKNCVALNEVITRTSGSTNTYFGRVVGYNVTKMTNNFALRDMTLIGIAEDNLSAAIISNVDSVHGEDITSAEWSNPSWWTKVVWNNESQTGGFAYDMEYADWWMEDDELDDSFSDDSELYDPVWDFSGISETSYPQLRNMP